MIADSIVLVTSLNILVTSFNYPYYLELYIDTEDQLFGEWVVETASHFGVIVLNQVAVGHHKWVGDGAVHAYILHMDSVEPLLGQGVAQRDVLDLEE